MGGGNGAGVIMRTSQTSSWWSIEAYSLHFLQPLCRFLWGAILMAAVRSFFNGLTWTIWTTLKACQEISNGNFFDSSTSMKTAIQCRVYPSIHHSYVVPGGKTLDGSEIRAPSDWNLILLRNLMKLPCLGKTPPFSGPNSMLLVSVISPYPQYCWL